MSLYNAVTGLADPVKFTSSMTALDLALTRALGIGVLSGLTADGTGTVQPGEALIGHVVALAAATLPVYVASATNYVYLQMPAAPACVGVNGKDAGSVVVNQTGAAPINAVLLAVVVTGAAVLGVPAITSVNNAPVGRVNLAAPLLGRTLITLAPKVLSVTPGTNYVIGADFSAAGAFADGCYQTRLLSSDPLLIVTPHEGSRTASKAFWTLHYQGTGSALNVTVTGSLKGEGWMGLTSAGIAAVWDALTSF